MNYRTIRLLAAGVMIAVLGACGSSAAVTSDVMSPNTTETPDSTATAATAAAATTAATTNETAPATVDDASGGTSLGLELKGVAQLALVDLPSGQGGVGAAGSLIGDDYPYKSLAPDSKFDPWGEYVRECTSFVAWRLHSVNKYDMPFYDNAAGWAAKAKQRNIRVDGTPAVGAVAWFPSGHVAWVAALDANNVTIEEYNFIPFVYGNRTLPLGYHGMQFIHFADLPNSPPPPSPPTPTPTPPPAPPAPVVCSFNDAGNGKLISAGKGSSFTDSRGYTYTVGTDCELTQIGAPTPTPTPPVPCSFNDAGNGKLISAGKGSTFTDSRGYTYTVGTDCGLTQTGTPKPTPPPATGPQNCSYNDAGNGKLISAGKGSTFTDSRGYTYTVGIDCGLTQTGTPAPTPPPTTGPRNCAYNDAGNGRLITAAKGSTFTDSLGNTYLVGAECVLTSA